ncbi:MAG: ribonuclease Y [Candidatus Pacebacteria bacterium]|nr:ribonuclease Y [Candidatus Paceibacterota bacterium]
MVMDDTQIREAQARAREIIVEAKDEALAIREKAERDARVIRQEISDKERSLDQKIATLDARLKVLDERDEETQKRKAQVDKTQLELEDLRQQLLKKLEHVAGLTQVQAKQQVLEGVERNLSKDVAQLIQAAESKAKEEADDKAREIIIDAMKHGATDYVAEYTVSVVKIPDDEVKGKIIGKDGRNIRSFELETGVDVDLDDQPGQVRISSFDPIRREIARISLERLVKDGRIQPTRIEETVKKVASEIEKITYEEGKKLCHAVGVYNLPADLMQILGRFKYRFSYGQNLIAHTLEETKIGIALAQEVGANVEVVKLGCLLHDIGKVVTEEEGSHVEVGVNLLKKYRIPQVVIDCVEQHHEDVPFTSNEAVLVYVADAISGARPGARYENYEEYVKRLTNLETIAKSYDAVKEAYAIQAGREVRVILNPQHSTDDDTIVLSHKIKERVQKEMTYPGTVTVTVIRETRGIDIAK